jgi:dynein heavy chain
VLLILACLTGTKTAIGMKSAEGGGEYMQFVNSEGPRPVECSGPVENWLTDVLVAMQETIRWKLRDSVISYEEKKRDEWVFDNAAQVTLVATQIWWATEVGIAFGKLEEGFETAMKDYYKVQVNNLNDLITRLQGKLTKGHRIMLQVGCTQTHLSPPLPPHTHTHLYTTTTTARTQHLFSHASPSRVATIAHN